MSLREAAAATPGSGASLRLTAAPYTTNIPARLDRLPWSGFHWLIVWALGITWILDGLEVTLVGAISGVLQEPQVMNFTPATIGFIASMYIAGAVFGSLVFGYLTDRWGRKRLFFITLMIYLGGVLLTALSWNAWSFALFRFVTGAGIGGEYSAINSAIDELIPAAYRGRVDIIVNGSYWIGAALGSVSTLVLLDPQSCRRISDGDRLRHGRAGGVRDHRAAEVCAGKPALVDDARLRERSRGDDRADRIQNRAANGPEPRASVRTRVTDPSAEVFWVRIVARRCCRLTAAGRYWGCR